MPDNWAYVFAAYGLAAFVLTAYWRHLARRERDLSALTVHAPQHTGRAPASPGPRRDASTSRASTPASTATSASAPTPASTSMNRRDERSQAPPSPGHPRAEPASRPPLQ